MRPTVGSLCVHLFIAALFSLATPCGCSQQPDSELADREQAIAESAKRVEKLEKQIEDLGTGIFVVRSIRGLDPVGAGRSDKMLTYGLTRSEHERCCETIPGVESFSPVRELAANVNNSNHPDRKPVYATILGCTPELLANSRLRIAQGKFLTEREVQSQSNVCVVSVSMAKELFDAEDPLGKKIYLSKKKIHLEVFGVVEDREPRAALADVLPEREFTQEVYIPISTMRLRLGDIEITKSGEGIPFVEKYELSEVTFKVDLEDVAKTAKAVEFILKSGDPNRQDVAVIVPENILKAAKAELRLLKMQKIND